MVPEIGVDYEPGQGGAGQRTEVPAPHFGASEQPKDKTINEIHEAKRVAFRSLRPRCENHIALLPVQFGNKAGNILGPIFPIAVHDDNGPCPNANLAEVCHSYGNGSLVPEIAAQPYDFHCGKMEVAVAPKLVRGCHRRPVVNDDNMAFETRRSQSGVDLGEKSGKRFPVIEYWDKNGNAVVAGAV
jgi:hypothetical protein